MDPAQPATPQELAEILRACAAERRPVTPLGAGLHQHLGAPPPAEAIPVRLTALGRIIAYAPADLTVTAETGVTLGALQEALGRHGQWLPWDPPGGAGATIGGLLAAGRAGPLRLGYGVPRDWVLGMRVALGDGRLVKSGGRVVKNVAGYDAHKLHIGALGTLGVIAEVTFKVAPLPEHTAALAGPAESAAQALQVARALWQRPLSPVSLCVSDALPLAGEQAGAGRRWWLAARFAGVGPAVERQVREARLRAREVGLEAAELDRERSEELWREVAAFPQSDAGRPPEVVLRAGAPASAIVTLAEALERHAPPASHTLLYPGVGLAYARWPAHGQGLAGALAALRQKLAGLQGYAVVEAAPPELRAQLDLWGPPPETIELMRRLKAAWDPAGILNPGRYVGGI